MKVLHCLDTLAVGGAERVAVDACNLLNRTKEYNVKLLLIRHGGPLLQALNPEIMINELRFYRKTSIIGWLKLIYALRGFDIIHVHMRHTYGRVKLAAMISGLRTKIIIHDHYGDIEHNKTIPSYLNGRFKPKYYIGVSKDLSDWATTSLLMTTSNTWTLANTIAREFPERIEGKRSKTMVLVSNLRATKNIEFAIQLAKKSGLDLDIYGQVIDPDYFQHLKDLGAGYSINFKTDVSDVFPHLPKYRLAIHTAKSETGPLVAMEYLKTGTTFLAFNTGEVVRQIKTQFPELILYDFDESNWLRTIDKVLKDPIPEESLKEVFARLFSPESYSKKLHEIYQWVAVN